MKSKRTPLELYCSPKGRKRRWKSIKGRKDLYRCRGCKDWFPKYLKKAHEKICRGKKI